MIFPKSADLGREAMRDNGRRKRATTVESLERLRRIVERMATMGRSRDRSPYLQRDRFHARAMREN
jgi:hypothetical protein